MLKDNNNPIFQYLFILNLCIALLIAQTSGLHMHVQHDDHPLAASDHIVDIHTVSILQDIETHHNGPQDQHHHAAVDISQDYLIKKANLLNLLALVVFFIGLFLYVPRLFYICSQWRYKSLIINPCYYFLQPPLRAPPAS